MKEFHKRRIHKKKRTRFGRKFPPEWARIHFTSLLDYLKSSDIFCPRKLLWAKIPLPEQALQKISLDFCLKNQSCDRRKFTARPEWTQIRVLSNLSY